MCMVRDDSPRTNYVTSLITFYLRLGLFRRFWRRTERTLECSKCSVEYLQHFCYVLRFAPTLRFTLWFVHKTFEVVRSVPAININKICKKKSFDNKSKHHRDSAIRNWLFLFNGWTIPSNNVIFEAKAALHHCWWDWKWNNRFHC